MIRNIHSNLYFLYTCRIMSAGEIQPRAYEAYSIIANALEIPFLNWELSPLTSEPIMNTKFTNLTK